MYPMEGGSSKILMGWGFQKPIENFKAELEMAKDSNQKTFGVEYILDTNIHIL